MNRLSIVAIFALALTLVFVAPTSAAAHARSESHSSWVLDGKIVRLTFTIADLEAKRLTDNGASPGDAQLLGYVRQREWVEANGAKCPLMVPPRAVAAAPGYRRLELVFDCHNTSGVTLHSDAFFDIVPTHVNMAQIEKPNGDFIEQILKADDREIATARADGADLENAGLSQFVAMGIMHIFTGIDHMSFLVGLVLISRRFRDLAFVVTGFTLGHSLTLALAVTGLLRPHAEFIDALVALTIALIGVENIAVATRGPGAMAIVTAGGLFLMALLKLLGIGLLPFALLFGAALFAGNYLMVCGHLRDAGRLRLVVTLVFGLIHGFGFAADLLETHIPVSRLAELLVGFNLGVEIGQLTLVIALSGLVLLLSRVKLTLPRPIVVDVAASLLVAIGVYWFVGRSFV